MNQHTTPSTAASSAQIGEALKILFNSLPLQRGTDSEGAIVAYAEALRGLSVEAVEAGVSKFLRGECENINPRYVPTPPELARIIRTAVVPERVPQERRLPRFVPEDDAAKARMRLKFPMFCHAFPSPTMMDELARANEAGMEEMILLATKWGVPVPDELNGQTDADWHTARNRAWAEIDRNPPPFMRKSA